MTKFELKFAVNCLRGATHVLGILRPELHPQLSTAYKQAK